MHADIDGPLPINASSISQPIPIDFNGDMKIDLLGMTPTSRTDPEKSLRIWQNVWNFSDAQSPLFNL